MGKSSPYGGRGPQGALEKDINLALARRTAERLGGAALTRHGDQNPSLAERIRTAADSRADAFVSLHLANDPSQPSGTNVWVHDASDARSFELARALSHAMGASGVRTADLAVLSPAHHDGRTAACIVQVDNLAQAQVEQRLLSEQGLDELAGRLANGLRAFSATVQTRAPAMQIGALRPGDVLVKVSDGSSTSRLIKLGQWLLGKSNNADFTHAAILGEYAHGEEPMVIESSGGGLLAHGLMTDNHQYSYLVFRCTDAAVGTGAGSVATMLQAHAAADPRRFQYSQVGAVMSLIKGVHALSWSDIDTMLASFFDHGRTKSSFCSEFVLLCLAIANQQVRVERHQTAATVPGGFFTPSNPDPSTLLHRLEASPDFTLVGSLPGPR